MLKRRIIARLDIKGEHVVKGRRMEGLRVVGEPNAMARKYAEDGADEILMLDVVASLYGRNALHEVIERASDEVLVPITVGGGIRTVADIKALLRAGADKVAINTAALRWPPFVREAAETFGSQAIVVQIDAKRHPDGWWQCMAEFGREPTPWGVRTWMEDAAAIGAGEFLVTAIDRDGTQQGLDHGLLELLASPRPIIVSGGASSPADVAQGLARADAVALGAYLHGGGCLRALKSALRASYAIREASPCLH